MSTKYKLLLALRNPLIVIPPFVIILGLGWQQYTYAGRDLSLPTPTLNLLPNGGFSEFDGNGIPTGWQLTQKGAAQYQASSGHGYAGGSSLKLAVTDYQTGDLALSSPTVAVHPGKTYLFKGYYSTTTPFTLLVNYTYADGSSNLQLVRTYPAATDIWSTASDAFTAPANLTNVQFVYRIYGNGQLELNSLYLEEQQDVYVAPTITGANILTNNTLTATDYSTPDGWTTYHSGDNNVTFSYQQDPGGAYVQEQIADYKDGQAKWQYSPQPVKQDQYYQTSVSYQSDTPVPLVAEYVLQNGQRQDQTVAELPPADSWTTVTSQFQTMPSATTMFLALPLEHAGTVASRNYTLIDITKPGTAHWQQPMVSISFDDGWEQAYQNVAPLLKQTGYKATFYINPSTIETPNFMTANELTALSDNGNEIAAHGYEHRDMTAINEEALDFQLHEGRDYLQQAGFQVSDFASPYGRGDAEVTWYAQKYFTTMRGTDSGINTLQNLDPYNLKVLYVTNTTQPADIATALQLAKQYNGWLILDYHQVSGDPRDSGSLNVENASTTPTALKQEFELIRASGIKVAPVSTVYKTLQHQS